MEELPDGSNAMWTRFQAASMVAQSPSSFKAPFIRVSGYAVKFIDLTREQQLDVIARTCHDHM